MLAMLFLVLFATMAVGFYASTDTSSQVAANDEHVSRAAMAAEVGMNFMTYQLAHVQIPPATTDVDGITDKLYSDLQTALNGTGNLGAYTISKSGYVISIPGDPAGAVKLDSNGNASFRATITVWPTAIVVKTVGNYGNISSAGAARAIQMDFTRTPHTTSIFDYAVASKGQIVAKKGDVTAIGGVDPKIATLMSDLSTAGAITVSGGTIGGDLNVLEDASAVITGGSVGGSSVPANILSDHVHVVDHPEFPTLDPTVFKQYATNNWVNKAKVQSNILIKAGTNPKFNANDTVQGIMYIESPNVVTFNGDFNLKGLIVMEGGVVTTDALNFSGNLTSAPVPSGTQYDALRAISGIAILAPNAAMNMSGSSGGNVKGSVIVKTFSFSGAANLQIDQGTLMTLDPGANSAIFGGSKAVLFSATGSNNQPSAGVSYSSYYVPDPGKYKEVMP
jgi:hypothetical protein